MHLDGHRLAWQLGNGQNYGAVQGGVSVPSHAKPYFGKAAELTSITETSTTLSTSNEGIPSSVPLILKDDITKHYTNLFTSSTTNNTARSPEGAISTAIPTAFKAQYSTIRLKLRQTPQKSPYRTLQIQSRRSPTRKALTHQRADLQRRSQPNNKMDRHNSRWVRDRVLLCELGDGTCVGEKEVQLL
jgi:hypothetical protein